MNNGSNFIQFEDQTAPYNYQFGDSPGDRYGNIIKINSAGNVIAVGTDTEAGYVDVFELNNNGRWAQKDPE